MAIIVQFQLNTLQEEIKQENPDDQEEHQDVAVDSHEEVMEEDLGWNKHDFYIYSSVQSSMQGF